MDKFKDEKNKKLITKKKADRINKQDLKIDKKLKKAKKFDNDYNYDKYEREVNQGKKKKKKRKIRLENI